jgi:acetyl/propionyl-CoA carboxylase alpha subunit
MGKWLAKKQAAAFGNDGMYMEKVNREPRHIEIQIVGDSSGKLAICQKGIVRSKEDIKTYRRNSSPIYDKSTKKKNGRSCCKSSRIYKI